MIKLMLLIMMVVGLGGSMLIVRQMNQPFVEKILTVAGYVCVALSWVMLIINFTFFVSGWRQYVAHEVVKQAPQSNATLRILAPLFEGVFSIGPAILMGVVLSLASVVVGVICLARYPEKVMLPFAFALINIVFLMFAERSLQQLITYLPYTMDRVVGTLVMLLAYSAALFAQTAVTLLPIPSFLLTDDYEDYEDEEEYERYGHYMPSAPMQAARMVSLKADKPIAAVAAAPYLQPVPSNSQTPIR